LHGEYLLEVEELAEARNADNDLLIYYSKNTCCCQRNLNEGFGNKSNNEETGQGKGRIGG
jgi:hypothetical protein